MQLIIVKSFLTPDEARMMQSLLRSEGIASFLKDENTGQIAPYLLGAISGVKILVAEIDVEKTLSVLQEAGYIEEQKKENVREWWKIILLFIIVGILLVLSRLF